VPVRSGFPQPAQQTPRLDKPSLAASLSSSPSFDIDYTLNKQINRTQDGLLLLLIGTILGPIPILNILGVVLALVGAVMVVVGRDAFGERHARYVEWSVGIYILGFMIFLFVLVGASSSIETTLRTTNAASLSSALTNIVELYFLLGTLSGAIIGISTVLFTYAIQDHRGRIILWSALATGLVLSLSVDFVLAPELGNAVSRAVATSSVAPLNSFLATVAALRVAGLIPAFMYALAFYMVWSRIGSGKISQPVSATSLLPADTSSMGGS